jgi:aryl-alcohol dehydrogenase-like predicted oxidoreductase
MQERPLGRTGLAIAPLVFGGNVFGWTADETTSFALLDRFLDHGFNAVDTADSYSMWAPGNHGGESEAIIGRWLKAAPARRDKTVLITKVGSALGQVRKGLSARHIMAAAEDSLRRLQTDRIDVYLSHYPDPETPIAETLRAYEELIRQGKVRAIGASNFSAGQLHAALDTSRAKGLPRYETLQPEYNLYDRAGFEGPLRDLAVAEGLCVITYYSLASGFLSGKYRSKEDLAKSVRGAGIGKYLDARGMRILDALDSVARAHGAKPAEVALAWLIARDDVTAPIASATSLAQLDSLLRAAQLSLGTAEIDALNTASA